MIKFIKKLIVRFRKKDKKFEPTETHFGEIETNLLSGFVVDDPDVNPTIYSNFTFYQEADYDDKESINELMSFQQILEVANCHNVLVQYSAGTILIISGSISDYNALNKLYENDYKYAYHKHLKNLLNYLHDYKILDSVGDNSREEVLHRLKNVLYFPVEIDFCDSHDIHISNTSAPAWKTIIDKYKLKDNIVSVILPMIAVYYNAANLDFEESSEEYTTYNITTLSHFLYDYTYNFEECITARIDELYKLIPSEFMIDALDKNIYELNLFSNPLDQSSLYDDVDEIID